MLYDPYTAQVRKYLETEIEELDKVGGLTKVDSLNSEDLNDYLVNLYDYPELEHFVLKNSNDNYDLFLRYRSDQARIDVGHVIKSAYEDFEKNKYYQCIKKLFLVLRRASSPKSEVYDLVGLSYNEVGEEALGRDYIRISNYINKEKDYNNVDIDKARERVEKEMRKERKNNYNQMDIETAGKELGLSNEEIDIIKLIFAREFYKQGDMDKGDFYLNSVEKTSGKSSNVTRLCLEARTNKRFFQYRDNNEPKKLSLIKPGKRK